MRHAAGNEIERVNVSVYDEAASLAVRPLLKSQPGLI